MTDKQAHKQATQWLPIKQLSWAIGALLLSLAQSATAEEIAKRPHPILHHSFKTTNIDGLKERVAVVVQMREDKLVSLLPRQVPRHTFSCPACRADKPHDKRYDGNSKPAMPYAWDHNKPDQIACKACKRVYPNNDYPADRVETFHNPKMEKVTVRHYFDPHKVIYSNNPNTGGKTGRKYYLEAYVDNAKWEFMWPQLKDLATLYHLTNDEIYARKAVLIANAYATRFHQFLLSTKYGHEFLDCKRRGFPWGYIDTRWGRRMPDESMESFMEVVDLIFASKSMDQVGQELGVDVRDNLFKVFDSGLKRRLAYRGYDCFGQLAGYKEFLNLAKVFEQPELSDLVLQTYYDFPRYAYSSDGSFWEGTGYSQIQSLYTAQMREDDNFSHPASYRAANRVDNLKHWSMREDFYRKSYFARNDIRYPNGNAPVIQDSSGFNPIWRTVGPRYKSESLMKSGYKHVILGAGERDDQIQVQLGYGVNSANHGRQDTLGLQIYALGRPLIDSFPYHKSSIRTFSNGALTHNTVVVDHKAQDKLVGDGDPLLFDPTLPGFNVFCTDASRAYRGTTSIYKRTLALNAIEIKKPYLIDVFQVTGGNTHDYHLKSASYFAQTASSSLPMGKMPGERPLLPANDPWRKDKKARSTSHYQLFFDVKQAPVKSYANIDFRCRQSWDVQQKKGKEAADPHAKRLLPHKFDSSSWKDKAVVGTRHHVVGQDGQTAYLAQVPALRRTGFYGEPNREPIDWKERQPHLILRSEPTNADKSSLFVVVHEPFYDKANVGEIAQLDLGDPNILALEIPFIDDSGRKDLFIYSLNGEPVSVRHEDVVFEGTVGLVTSNNKGQTEGYLVSGTKLAKGKQVSLDAEVARYTGEVIASSRKWDQDQRENSFTVSSDIALPEGRALSGKWIMLKHHGEYPVKTRGEIKALRPEEGVNPWGLDAKTLQDRWFSTNRTRKSSNGTASGGGNCFEIAYVEKRDGRTIIHTTEDHGLIIKDGSTEEYFYPCRTFPEGSTFTIHNSIASRLQPRVFPAGGAFIDRLQVTCASNEAAHPLKIAVTKPDAQPTPDDWRPYTEPVTITQSSDLHVVAVDKNNVEPSKASVFSFSKAMPGERIQENKLKSGLNMELWRTGKASPSTRTSGTVSATKEEYASYKRMRFSGYLKVDKPDVYTFNYLADRDGLLRIGGKEVLPRIPNLISLPTSRVATIALEAGYHPIELELHRGSAKSARWDPMIKLEWRNKTMARQDVPAESLFHQK